MPTDEQTQKLIELLNDVLCAELTGINQYFLHSEMCENWGYERLHKANRHHSIDEMKHAEQMIKRILYLKGVPNVQKLGKVNIGETVEEQLRCDHALEKEAIERLNLGIEQARELGDAGTRLLLEESLKSEEEHVDWLEAQLDQIAQIGLPGYLAEQIHE